MVEISEIGMKIGAFLESQRVVNIVMISSISLSALILVAMAYLALHPIGEPRIDAYRYVPESGSSTPY